MRCAAWNQAVHQLARMEMRMPLRTGRCAWGAATRGAGRTARSPLAAPAARAWGEPNRARRRPQPAQRFGGRSPRVPAERQRRWQNPQALELARAPAHPRHAVGWERAFALSEPEAAEQLTGEL